MRGRDAVATSEAARAARATAAGNVAPIPPIASTAAEITVMLDGISGGSVAPFVPEEERSMWWAQLRTLEDEFRI